MSNMRVKIAGVEFKNPIIAASGTFGFGQEYSDFYDVSKLGGICSKGVTKEPRKGNGSPRIAETAAGILNSVGLQNPGIDAFINKELDYFGKLDTVRIVNVAGSTIEDYCDTVARLEGQPVDMIELNISCPNVKAGGMAFGIYPDSVENIVSKVRKCTLLPLIVKLSPNIASVSDNARAAESGGADAISLINTLSGMAIDWRARKPVLKNVVGGLSGPAVKPVALRMVHEAYKAVNIPIIGMGGIMTADDIMEFIVAGATAVQVGSANIFDPNAGLSLVIELTNLINSCNISIGELTGTLTY